MDQENEIKAMWQIIRPYRFFIPLCGIILAAVGLFGQLGSPKLYQAEALVALPKTSGAQPEDPDTALVSAAETRALINLLKNKLRQGNEPGLKSDTLLQKLRLARVDDVRGTGNYFKMTVQSPGSPQATLAVMDRLVGYLNGNQYLKNSYELKRGELEAAVNEAALALERAQKLKDEGGRLVKQRVNMGFNPVELETEMNELQGRHLRLKTRLSLAHDYRYLEPPYARPGPVSPRPWRNFFIFGVLGLLLGLMLALLGHLFRIVSKGA